MPLAALTTAGPSAGLLVAAAALAVWTVRSARRPVDVVPDLGGYLDRWSALHDGFDPRGNRWVRGWLALTYRVARPLARIGALPDVLTLWGLWLAAAVVVATLAGGRWLVLAGLLVVGSGLVDSVDGAVAALTGRSTRFGHVLDSVVDRASEAAFLAALWIAGAPAALVLAAGGAGVLQEHARARAGSVGLHEVGVVTVGERATRVILCGLALVAGGVAPAAAEVAVTTGSAVLAVLAVVALGQVLRFLRRALGALDDAAPARERRA
jgi:phosphatidylglycerophosphate synthase